MPYIKKNQRPKCDAIVERMMRAEIQPTGELNYLLYKYCAETVEPGYNNYKNFVAELHECAHEIRRRFMAPYENEKITENGDV